MAGTSSSSCCYVLANPTNSCSLFWAVRNARARTRNEVKNHMLPMAPGCCRRVRITYHPPFVAHKKCIEFSDEVGTVNERSRRAADSDMDTGLEPSPLPLSSSSEGVQLLKEQEEEEKEEKNELLLGKNLWWLWEWAVLVSPFFFWGTAMVAMKQVLPRAGPYFVSAFRLIPSGFLLIAFSASRGRSFPSGLAAWLSIAVFALVDASCFQVSLSFSD